MKSKNLFQAFVFLVMLLSMVGSAQPAYAQDPAPTIVVRTMTYWDATYHGYVDATRYENWPFVLDGTYDFSVTVTPTSGDLAPLVLLLDENGAELVSNTGSLTATQPAGNYSVQVQPEAGSGFYDLTIRQTTNNNDQSVSTEVNPTSLTVGEAAAVTVNLNNVPAEGYASAEFTCTYDPALVQVSNIAVTSLFGTDPATAINDPQNGTFIVAIAGSNGQKATTSGAAFTFDVTSLLAGQATITCTARVSPGGDGLIDLPGTGATLTINDVAVEGTLAGQVIASKEVTVNLYNADTTLATSVAANPDGTFSLTASAGSYTVEATASGFLSAQGPATVNAGETTTMATISLLAGDIDGNAVIDQFDALTIGMSYNTASPDAADLNADGVINVLDLELLAANYHATGPAAWE